MGSEENVIKPNNRQLELLKQRKIVQERMGLGGNGGREELARENLELKASYFLPLVSFFYPWIVFFHPWQVFLPLASNQNLAQDLLRPIQGATERAPAGAKELPHPSIFIVDGVRWLCYWPILRLWEIS